MPHTVTASSKTTSGITVSVVKAAPKTPALEENYYLDNFNTLIDFVHKHYAHLLTAEEHSFYRTFNTLSNNARRLFVRLVLRVHTNIRYSKIDYPELHVPDGLNELRQTGFVKNNDCIDECLPLFTRAELSKALGHELHSLQHVDISAWLTPDLLGDSPVSKLFTNDNVIAVNYKDFIVTFRLLFFGNLYHDFSSFVLRDLGYQRFEDYNVDRDTLLFQTREQVDSHLHFYHCADLYEEAFNRDSSVRNSTGVDSKGPDSETLQKLHDYCPAKIPSDKPLCRRIDKLKNKIARQLERNGDLHAAANIYTNTAYPPARERLARIETKIGNTTDALKICHQIIESPRDTDELDFALTFGNRLAKKSETAFPVTTTYTPPATQLRLEKNNLSVEFSVALHYAKSGKCYYVENDLFSGVFGLVFWDIIFAPVKGAFFHPFQTGPSDFYEPEFSIARHKLIEDRISSITGSSNSSGAISSKRLQHYVNLHQYHKRGIRNPLVTWIMCRKHILDLALKRIPVEHWIAIFRLILTDIRNYRSGQPDLVFFPDEGGYQLLEVKAPGDKLQKNQLRWMRFFNEQNMPHGVVHVEWLDDCPR